MAGDWIKMRQNLGTHPKVVRIMSATGAARFPVIGGLHALWSIFDTHSEDGRLAGYTLDLMDSTIGWPGFSAAVAGVGWLEETPEGLVMPGFDQHNGQSAKRRAEDQRRKADSRKRLQSVTDQSGHSADKSVTREEKSYSRRGGRASGKPAISMGHLAWYGREIRGKPGLSREANQGLRGGGSGASCGHPVHPEDTGRPKAIPGRHAARCFTAGK